MTALGFLISYDHELVKTSLPLVYQYAEKIVFAMDSKRKTLTGTTYKFDEDFKRWVAVFDGSNKISWLEQDFFIEGASPGQIVIKQRNILLETMKPANWFIQLDADEYFIAFEKFVTYLHNLQLSAGDKCSVSVKWKTIFKKVKNGYLVIAGREERIQAATNFPFNTHERHYEGNAVIDSDFFMLHQSWARSEAEIKTKIENWSHAHDFDTRSFYDSWLACNEKNYKRYNNFHPLHGPIWPRLEFVEASSIDDLIEYYSVNPPGPEVPNPAPFITRLKQKAKHIIKGSAF